VNTPHPTTRQIDSWLCGLRRRHGRHATLFCFAPPPLRDGQIPRQRGQPRTIATLRPQQGGQLDLLLHVLRETRIATELAGESTQPASVGDQAFGFWTEHRYGQDRYRAVCGVKNPALFCSNAGDGHIPAVMRLSRLLRSYRHSA
jgi:hypothetical protein